jgi:hypothetical protein
MPHEPTGSCPRVQRVAVKRCPACASTQPVENFYTTRRGRLSGYCKSCQRAAARLSDRRRDAAIRLLIASHPEEYQVWLRLVRGGSQPHLPERGAGDAA